VKAQPQRLNCLPPSPQNPTNARPHIAATLHLCIQPQQIGKPPPRGIIGIPSVRSGDLNGFLGGNIHFRGSSASSSGSSSSLSRSPPEELPSASSNPLCSSSKSDVPPERSPACNRKSAAPGSSAIALSNNSGGWPSTDSCQVCLEGAWLVAPNFSPGCLKKPRRRRYLAAAGPGSQRAFVARWGGRPE